MMIEPDYWLAAAAAGSLILVLLACLRGWRTRRQLHQRLAACEQSLGQVEQAIQSSATIFAALEARLDAACEQMDQLSMRQGAIDATGHKAAFQQAIALMRRGASAEELVSVCGVSQGEARLIQTMYGTPAPADASARAN
ncbi:MAG: DUF2802 domain-containing protein [Gammaproteobacteria bacterium]|jgi:septal ring factor EnvC (AmiA/AmiB activator)|nr:DUF2802 domain-containing protein [Gammaproteobacteria bacterium]